MARVGWVRAAGTAALVGLMSCYDWVAIHPTDIPRFAALPHEVAQPDGSNVRFDGEVAVKVHTAEGTLTYWNPHASIDDGWLAISGESGAPPAEIPLRAIDRAKAGQLNAIETVATIVVSLAAAATVVALYKYSWFNYHSGGVE